MSAPSPATCPNCGHRLAPWDKFCAQCGQAAQLHQPSFWEFVHEFINHYVALEGTLWHSLKVLLLKPGQLTLDYLQGRRARQVLPLRLFLTFSLLFFLCVGVSRWLAVPAPEHETVARTMRDGAGGFTRGLSEGMGEGDSATSAPTPSTATMLANAPRGVMLSLPLFAGLLAWAFRARRRAYGEHFVFTLHVHALWYLALCGVFVFDRLPWVLEAWLSGGLLMYAFLFYPWLAMRRVYGGRWWTDLLRWLLLSLAYAVCLLASVLGLSVLTASA